jgi:glycosyltransferase involved in cell wall biosynthesis
MTETDPQSIFARYYEFEPFIDRFEVESDRAVDVIIPVIHTNELWRANLLSIYREVPVNRLIIGDGGCVDGSIDIAREFPRVEVLDHRNFTSLGYSLRHLIEAVRTEWFVYLHSDVYLPPGWFSAMCVHRKDYDWFECDQRITVLAEYPLDLPKIDRAFSGSQMGRKAAFEKVTPLIDDDYLYRNEDVIFAKLVERAGFRYGKAQDIHHFHQVMFKPSRWRRGVKRVDIYLDLGPDEEIRAHDTFARGIIKYLDPAEMPSSINNNLRESVVRLVELGDTTHEEFRDWVRRTNPAWLPTLGSAPPASERFGDRLVAMAITYRDFGAGEAARHEMRRLMSSRAIRRTVSAIATSSNAIRHNFNRWRANTAGFVIAVRRTYQDFGLWWIVKRVLRRVGLLLRFKSRQP